MTYEVKTDVFEGPLELLLQLINQHHVDVTRVNITGVVDGFWEKMEARRLDIDAASGFVLMAALLIQLKVRFLLADRDPIELEEELALLDERDRLLARLLAFLTFKDAAVVLGHRLARTARRRGRSAGIDQELGDPSIPALPSEVTPGVLAAVFEGLVEVEPVLEPEVDHLDFDLPSIGDAIEVIRARITADLESTFSRLVSHCKRRVEVAAYFLAVLELARWGVVSVAQEDPSEIEVRRRADASAGAPDGGYGYSP